MWQRSWGFSTWYMLSEAQTEELAEKIWFLSVVILWSPFAQYCIYTTNIYSVYYKVFQGYKELGGEKKTGSPTADSVEGSSEDRNKAWSPHLNFL